MTANPGTSSHPADGSASHPGAASGRAPRLVAVQHEDGTDANRFGRWLAAAGADVRTVRPDRGEALPGPAEFDGLVVLGGALGPLDDEQAPWLAPVRELLAESAAGAFPSFSICLGGELLAVAAGGTCTHRAYPQVGLHTVEATARAAEDPVFGAAPAEFPTVLWHEEQIELPERAVLLVTGTDAPVQAFRVGPCAWGTQFHPEAGRELAAHWAAKTNEHASMEDYAGRPAEAVVEEIAAAERALETAQAPLARAFVRAVRRGLTAHPAR
ncbi:type 1 glutamine amidotransferase [Brevibacterium sp. BRM-1]|uniref:type 1 glutamine amidotransferase n=1 Tax=Brevibacterium sp. BRM-1 TaxID=2999062 RepID=UPI0022822AC0|nr:type 1 glutamine amidotransferase [Brevibacterium sp. BRM-1]WAL39674.1 type 1 glutamine amidotransferase [Brevibacterium sp. BRM-1]